MIDSKRQHKAKDCWEKMKKVPSLHSISPEDTFIIGRIKLYSKIALTVLGFVHI